MPIIRKKGGASATPMRQSFVGRIKSGNVLPIISDRAMADLIMGGHKQMVEGYADYIEYPLEDKHNLLRMTKFKSITNELDSWDLKADFLNFLKNWMYQLAESEGVDEDLLEEVAEEADDVSVSEFARRLGYPKFADGQQDPLLILAGLPLPIYITTSHHTFLEEALRTAGKAPKTELCHWHPGLNSLPSLFDDDYEPTPTEPLVYHLHGMDTRPDSLVLTEDDYLEFLVSVSQGHGEARVDPIPARVRQAVSDSAPILLGFDLPDWAFRVIYWGLIKPATMIHKGVFSLQLKPSEVEKKYLQDYLKRDAQIDIFWGNVEDYTKEISQQWRG